MSDRVRLRPVAEDDLAEQRSLEKAGFTREGVLRGSHYRAGAWRDEVIYGVVRADVRLE